MAKIFVTLHTFRGMRGFQQSLIFHIKTLMVDKNVVKSLVDEWLEGKEYFLVDIQISPDDKIVVEIDHADSPGMKRTTSWR